MRSCAAPEDRDNLSAWLTDANDDAGNARPAYIASKNVFFPNQTQIDSLELYISKYLRGWMQMTEKEKYPYGIYGIPNFKVNRESPDEGATGRLISGGSAKEQPILVDDGLAKIQFIVENRAGRAHEAGLTIAGLPDGECTITAGGKTVTTVRGGSMQETKIALPIGAGASTPAAITRNTR